MFLEIYSLFDFWMIENFFTTLCVSGGKNFSHKGHKGHKEISSHFNKKHGLRIDPA